MGFLNEQLTSTIDDILKLELKQSNYEKLNENEVKIPGGLRRGAEGYKVRSRDSDFVARNPNPAQSQDFEQRPRKLFLVDIIGLNVRGINQVRERQFPDRVLPSGLFN
jgi:hypothetical protein